VQYVVFDLLYCCGRCLLNEPLARRREELAALCARLDLPEVLFSAGVVEAGTALYALALAQGHEGVVAKRLSSTYRPGRRSLAWRKIKPRGHAAIALIPKDVADLQADWTSITAMEQSTLNLVRTTAERVDRGQIPDTQFADLLERDVLPQWRASADRFRETKHLSAKQQRLVSLLLDYVQARQKHWELLAQAMREHNSAKLAQAEAQAKLADRAVETLNKEK
jgi:hypothetical protein